MRASANVGLQVTALTTFTMVRTAEPGLALFVFVATACVLTVLLPTVLAVLVRRRTRRLPRSLAAPFVVCAVLLVLGALLIPDVTLDDQFMPGAVLFLGVTGVPEGAEYVAMSLAVGYLGSLAWLVRAVVRYLLPPEPLVTRPATTGPAATR